MGRVVHFEIHASEPERLVSFYQDLFDWKIQKWDPVEYWLVTTGEEGTPGIHGGLMRRHGDKPALGQAVNAFVCTVEVDDCAAMMARAQSLGGTVALEKMAVAGIGWVGYILDPDGNIFGMMQNDPTAA